jgi:hypothetical protein
VVDLATKGDDEDETWAGDPISADRDMPEQCVQSQ